MSVIRIAQGYRQMTDARLIAAAGAAIQGLTGNARFTSPTVDLKTVQTALDEFAAAVAAQPNGGTAATAQKKTRRAALTALMSKLAHYVQDNCDDDVASVVAAGFTIIATGRANAPLEKPSIRAIDFGKSTELVVRVKPVWRARTYDVRVAPLTEEGAPGPWQNAGLFTGGRAIKVGGLTPLTTYTFQVRAVGASGSSDWSDAVSHVCL
jgi:uncharacterized protein (UPF0261 family)